MQEKNLDSPSEAPIACTLTATNLRDRQQAWLKIGNHITASAKIPGGLVFEFANATGLAESVTKLVQLEAECCAWMAFAMSESPDEIRLSITSNSEDGERAVREAFAPLVRSSGV